jgi:hypothetical protein
MGALRGGWSRPARSARPRSPEGSCRRHASERCAHGARAGRPPRDARAGSTRRQAPGSGRTRPRHRDPGRRGRPPRPGGSRTARDPQAGRAHAPGPGCGPRQWRAGGQRAHRGGRGPKAVKPLHDEARGAAGGDLLQGVTQPGPLGVCAGRRSQVAHHGNQLQPTSLAGTTDCVRLTSKVGLSRSLRLGADGHVSERAPADRRHRRVARNPSG